MLSAKELGGKNSDNNLASLGSLNCVVILAGDHSGGATPVPIPNTAVKPSSADGTCGATRRESRTSPASI